MLVLALTARAAGQRPSKLAGVNDAVAALDFDIACNIRLQQYDLDVAKAQAKRIAYEVGQLFAGEQAAEDAAVPSGVQAW